MRPAKQPATAITPLIMVDENVHESEVARCIPNHGAQIIRSVNLPVDYVFSGKGIAGAPITIGYERKRLRDLANSIRSGRLMQQFRTATEWGCDRLGLIFEDPVRLNPKTREYEILVGREWRTSQPPVIGREIQNYLRTLDQVLNIEIIKTNRPDESAQSIVNGFWWWQEAIENHKSWDSKYEGNDAISLLNKPELIQRLVGELDGWGSEKARQFRIKYAHTGITVVDALAMAVDGFRTVRGVGKVLAESAYNQLNAEIR